MGTGVGYFMLWLFYCALLYLAYILFNLLLLVIRKKPVFPRPEIDDKELNDAEKRLNAQLAEYVPIEIFKNATDELLVEIVGFLDSQGIDAIYEGSPTPYNFLNTYTLSVKKDQREEAMKALEMFRPSKG